VVGDGPGELFGAHLVAEIPEQLLELVAREQEQQHQDVGLLGQLVAVRAVALRLQQSIQPLDVAVLLPVALPVELAQLLIALELCEHPVGVEHDLHLAGDVAPALQLGAANRQLVDQFLPVVRGE